VLKRQRSQLQLAKEAAPSFSTGPNSGMSSQFACTVFLTPLTLLSSRQNAPIGHVNQLSCSTCGSYHTRGISRAEFLF
jgi:hypothetical protein